ncbi:MAG: cobalt-zinc-cadmium efflux system outer membrane protein, partial [Methylophilaceae bacterium]
MRNKKQYCMSLLLSLIISGCATEPPHKPLARSSATILAKNQVSAEFNAYLIQQGYNKKNLPLSAWGLDELTLCALFYHTELDVAKQQLALANLAIQTAGTKKNPTINADIAHSNQKNGDIKPWAYGLSVDIPIPTNNKLGFKVEKAKKNAEESRMDVAETAWKLRNQIATDLISFHQNGSETRLFQQELEMHNSIANMLKKRVNAGIASRTTLNNVRLLALKTQHSLSKTKAHSKLLKAKLAADVGLTPEQFDVIKIKALSIENTLQEQAALLETPLETKLLQEQALLNRIDIRRSIAQYAAAEAEIKLQAAKQIPDITLSPGFLFEFGDKIWSLGFSSLFNLLRPNTALTEVAKQLRAIQGAKFKNLQATIIAEISQAHASYQAATQTTKLAKEVLTNQAAQEQRMRKQFNNGLIGKLDLMQ